MPSSQIQYSEKYYDDTYEYRHVVLPADIAKALPKNGRLLSEMEWRALGVQQSRGWIHYAIHKPEPHIMLFRRPLNYQQQQQAASRSTVAARCFAPLDIFISIFYFWRDKPRDAQNNAIDATKLINFDGFNF